MFGNEENPLRCHASRLRRGLKWTGLALCVLICTVWIGSFFFPVYPNWLRRDTTWFGGVGNGFIECYWPAGRLVSRSGLWFRGEVEVRWRPMFMSIPRTGGTCWYVGVPMWIIFGIVAGTTAFLWNRDRLAFPRGHCATCGYNLTGNVSGTCPECGERLWKTRG